MKRFLALVFVLIGGFSTFVPAQSQKYLDSLLTIANRSNPDSNSVNALTQLQRYYFGRGLFDSTLKYAKHTLPIARKLKNYKTLARVNYNLGLIYSNLSESDSARYYLDQVVELMPLIKDTILQINWYNAYSRLSNYESDYITAVEYLMKAAELIDRSASPAVKKWMPQTYGNISHNLIAEKQFKNGIDYGKKALKIRDYPDEDRYRLSLHLDIFDAYMGLSEIVIAKKYLDSAIQINASLNNIVMSSIVANNEGYYYQTIKDYQRALSAYKFGYLLTDSTKNDFLKAELGDNIAGLYFKISNYKEAEKFAIESNGIALRLKQLKVAASTYDLLKRIASLKGDYKSAVRYSELNKRYADSASNDKTKKTILSLESKYQNGKNEQEIAELTIANTQKELAVVKRNQALLVGGIAAAAALIVLGLFYKNSRQKQIIAERETTLQQEQIKFLERQQQIVSLQSMINGQETERTRIAKDLHDGLGGLFSTVKMYFSKLQHDTPVLKDDELFQKSYTLVDTASLEVRRIAHNMMPEVLMRLGLINALKDLCDNISAGKLLNVSLEAHGMSKRMNSTTEIMLFRIIQELINNIIKHADATEAIIQFILEDSRLSVTVEDNGKGFNTKDAEEQKHAGMATIQSRVTYLNGKMSIDSQKNVGTTIMMDFLINENSLKT